MATLPNIRRGLHETMRIEFHAIANPLCARIGQHLAEIGLTSVSLRDRFDNGAVPVIFETEGAGVTFVSEIDFPSALSANVFSRRT